MSKATLPRLREIRDTQKSAQELTPERDRLIRKAVREGHSETTVALASGLSPGRINQIIHQSG